MTKLTRFFCSPFYCPLAWPVPVFFKMFLTKRFGFSWFFWEYTGLTPTRLGLTASLCCCCRRSILWVCIGLGLLYLFTPKVIVEDFRSSPCWALTMFIFSLSSSASFYFWYEDIRGTMAKLTTFVCKWDWITLFLRFLLGCIICVAFFSSLFAWFFILSSYYCR